MDAGKKSVIIAAKDLLQAVIEANVQGIKVVRNSVDEGNEKTKRTNRFVCILTADGNFDERTAKTLKYATEDKSLYKIELRGSRKIPIELRVYAKSEDETDPILETIMSNIPRSWKIGRRNGTIDILTEHSNDYASNYKNGAMQSCFVMIAMEVGKKPEQIPTLPSATTVNGGLTQ